LRPRRSRRQTTSTSNRRRLASVTSRSNAGRRSLAPDTPWSVYSCAVQPLLWPRHTAAAPGADSPAPARASKRGAPLGVAGKTCYTRDTAGRPGSLGTDEPGPQSHSVYRIRKS
jgi:hypothetical protein